MIKVHGLEYEVRTVPSGLTSNFIGQTDLDNLVILVSDDINSQKQEEVLIHEIVHVFLMNEKEIMAAVGPDASEGLVTRLGTVIYDTLVKNDLLVEDWWERIVDNAPAVEGVRRMMTNVTEKNESTDRRIEHPDESVRSDGNEGTVLT